MHKVAHAHANTYRTYCCLLKSYSFMTHCEPYSCNWSGQTDTNTHSHIHTSSWVCSCFSAQQQSWKGTMGSNAIAVRTPYSVPHKSFIFLDPLILIPLLLPIIFKFIICPFSEIYFSVDLLYIHVFWVVCFFEPGSEEEWRHLGFTGQRKQLMAATMENELKTL